MSIIMRRRFLILKIFLENFSYLTMTEWSTIYGGKKANQSTSDLAEFRRLPFDHCALSLQPFENPYCDHHGNVFDLTALLPFLKKFKVNPITGEKLEAKQLTKLNFSTNAEDEYHCPVLYKVFNANTHIVAVRNTGNVFCYDVCWLCLMVHLST